MIGFNFNARVCTFRGEVECAIGQHDAATAVQMITQAYASDLATMDAQLGAAVREAAEAARRTRECLDLRTFAHQRASHEIWTGVRMQVHLKAAQKMLDKARSLAARARQQDGGRVGAADLEALLHEETPAPEWPAVIVAQVADDRISCGVFASEGGDTSRLFVGWALIADGPATGTGLEPLFLMHDRVLPKTTVEAEYGLKLVRLVQKDGAAAE